MSNDVINFDSIRLTTELNKYNRYKTIPTSFLDGTFSLKDLEKHYNSLSNKHQKIADRFIKFYRKTIYKNEGNLYNTFKNDYESFLKNQHTRSDEWVFPSVMAKYRANINPVRALIYEIREIMKSYNSENDYHVWLTHMITDNVFNNKLLDAVIKDRKRVDKVLNQYLPFYETSNLKMPIEITHLKTLRSDLLEYANIIASIKQWDPD